MSQEKDTGKLDLSQLIEESRRRSQEDKRLYQSLTFKDYIELVERDPKIAQTSAARLVEVVKDAGEREIPEEDRWLSANREYLLFSQHLFGIDDAIYKFVNHLRQGESKSSTGKQVLLLVGPVGSGKSTLARLLMKGLENYRKRPVFMIQGCPKQEEPLRLLDDYMRQQLFINTGIRVEGEVCPVCRSLVKEKFTDKDGTVRWWDVPVECFLFSIQESRGLTSFEPSDDKSSDITDLTGKERMDITQVYGYKHPLAYELVGKIPMAERGICEGRELLACDSSVLRVFFSLAEEKELTVQGSSFPHLSSDVYVIGHTNPVVFKKFNGNKELEGLHNRFIVVQVPYTLKIKKEVQLYKKLIEQESDFVKLKGCHIAPGALELAALFAVLTRLHDSSMHVPKLLKAKIYNGDRALTDYKEKDKVPIDIRHLREEGQSSSDIAKRGGMFGVGPRDVLAALNGRLVEGGCLTPLSAIKALREMWQGGQRMGHEPEQIEEYMTLLASGDGGSVMAEFREFVIKSAQQAFIRSHADLAQNLFDEYINEVDFYLQQTSKFVRGNISVRRDDATGKVKEPNEKIMRAIEEKMDPPVPESEKNTFRSEIIQQRARQRDFAYDTYRPLAKAIEKKLVDDQLPVLRLVLSTDKAKDQEAEKRAKDLFGGLSERGFCEFCAQEIIDRAREYLT